MSNRLKQEASLYLQQHAEQKIDWYPYGPEALQKAQDENKPIFLSIGYASCHWCHQMAEHCFSEEEIINYLNQNFICIKIDKEEHPDIDNYYQQACQLFTNSGGWPLSAFLLPDMRPFFVGTYFPPFSTEQQTGFLELCQELIRAYNEEHDKVLQNATEVTQKIADGPVPPGKVDFEGHFPHPMAILDATAEFQDKDFGGHGDTPKFPNFGYLEWALEQMLEGMIEPQAGEHVIKTLDNMLFGGLFDHVRGGIHRYAIDRQWQVPHFEKMLYDQAGLLSVLSKASLIYPAPHIFDSLIQTLEYLEAEMLSAENYFFTSQDADSEGQEGFYFGFTHIEFEDALTKNDDENETLTKNLEKLKRWFPLDKKGNFGPGLNTIRLDLKHKDEILSKEGWELIRLAKKALLKERKLRIPPTTDTKGVASWNFLTSKALVDVIHYCPIVPIKQQASKLLEKVLEGQFKTFLQLKKENDKQYFEIKHSTTKANSALLLEDYVFFAELQLRVYEISANDVFKENAIKTTDFIGKQFIMDNALLHRAKIFTEHHPYPNSPVSFFDGSYKSASSSYVNLIRRLTVLTSDLDTPPTLELLIENMTHKILKNPINAGEALRALTYPDFAYRVVKIPRHWATEAQFTTFIPYFLPRFVLCYTDEKEQWQICTKQSCELNGEGLENFIQTLTPQEVKEQQNK